MQEEIEQKSCNIMISTTKLSARTVLRAVKAAFRLYQSKASQGKQSVRTLLRQNRGVSSVEISKTGIRGLERYAKKYGIDYAIRKDTSEVPPRYLYRYIEADYSLTHHRTTSQHLVVALWQTAAILYHLIIMPMIFTDFLY